MLPLHEANSPINAANVAMLLAARLDAHDQEYALGGAIALGYWGAPRGTIDVDVTLHLSPERTSECLLVLGEIGCEFAAAKAAESLRENGFCRVMLTGVHVDVFLPTVPFYEAAFSRRKRVILESQPIVIWDAESLAVFKMMFFRRKDLADVEQILRTQGAAFDRPWVRSQLAAMYGDGDPRLANWDDLARDNPVD
ncbi:MAG TPA: hypothetical protein VJL29_02000 [Thermoguttaceae bacterium]|nr:hypothetical protein [Thermoguttaceae bacterium]